MRVVHLLMHPITVFSTVLFRGVIFVPGTTTTANQMSLHLWQPTLIGLTNNLRVHSRTGTICGAFKHDPLRHQPSNMCN